MSTRANIGIKRKDGTIEVVYNHSDGYPSYLGNNLLDNYTNKDNPDQTRQMVEMILSLGDISFLDERLQDSRTYNAWRNEGTTKKVYKDIKEYCVALGDSWIEYVYLWDEEKELWLMGETDFNGNTLVLYPLKHTEEDN
jgi:hypothetical protein